MAVWQANGTLMTLEVGSRSSLHARNYHHMTTHHYVVDV
jgi:hypothetical protein